ncbi:MAG TPA: isoprenylcysteine carboxylmethyltransferase family protein [Thermomicrobiales bacterium]|nr:isoprenylcysteine carboxylmethyltransferase family protein [Thermomicrobiales bacterium]
MAADERDNAGVIAPPPLIYAGAVVLGLLAQRAKPLPLAPRALARPLGALLAAGALLLGGWAAGTMRRAGTPLAPREPSTALVTAGPYRFSRNPIYLAMTLLGAGIALLTNAAWALAAALAAAGIVDTGVIEREERYLQRRFGQPYADYRARVRRWL